MIDITRPLGAATANWPGDSPFQLEWTLAMAAGDTVSVSRLSLSPHVGSHADAPLHYLQDGPSTASFRLDAFIGPARVVDARGSDAVTQELLDVQGAIGCTRVLVRSLDVVRTEEFVEVFPPLDPRRL
jgi:arylformamidase